MDRKEENLASKISFEKYREMKHRLFFGITET